MLEGTFTFPKAHSRLLIHFDLHNNYAGRAAISIPFLTMKTER